MSKESKCFDLNNTKQKKNYAKWKRFIKNLSSRTNENDKQSKKREKTKNFEDIFFISSIKKYCANRLDYNPLQGA